MNQPENTSGSIPAWLSILKSKLLELPVKISSAEEELHQAYSRKMDSDRRLRDEELNIMASIAGLMDPNTNKPVYPNEALRNAELAKRKALSLDYSKIEQEAAENEANVAALRREVAHLSNEFSAQKSIADLTSSYLRSRA